MKNRGKAENLKAYQLWYSRIIEGKWLGWHRPGGEEGAVSKHTPSLKLNTEAEATARLSQLGFDGADSAKKQITLNGQMTCQISGVCSYLVKHHKWTYVLPEETRVQHLGLTVNRRFGVPVPY